MSSQPELKITERDNTLNPRQLRQAGFVPGTVQGAAESQQVQIKTHELELALHKKPAEIKLSGAGFEGTVVVKAVQTNPVSQEVLHVTFLKPGGKAEKKPKAPAAKKAAPAKAKAEKAEKAEEPVTV